MLISSTLEGKNTFGFVIPYYKNKKCIENLELFTSDMIINETELRKMLVELKVINIQREMLIKKWNEKGAHFITFDTKEENFNV